MTNLVPLKQDPAWDTLPIPDFLIAAGTREARRAAWDHDMAALKAAGWGSVAPQQHSADLRAQADAAARERHRIKGANKREQASGVAADQAAIADGKTWDANKGRWV